MGLTLYAAVCPHCKCLRTRCSCLMFYKRGRKATLLCSHCKKSFVTVNPFVQKGCV